MTLQPLKHHEILINKENFCSQLLDWFQFRLATCISCWRAQADG